MNLGGLEQYAKYRGREITAIATERSLHAAWIAGDEARDHERGRIRGARRCQQAIQLHFGLLPEHRRTERTPLHGHAAACIKPIQARAHAALLQVAVEQSARPDLAVA